MIHLSSLEYSWLLSMLLRGYSSRKFCHHPLVFFYGLLGLLRCSNARFHFKNVLNCYMEKTDLFCLFYLMTASVTCIDISFDYSWMVVNCQFKAWNQHQIVYLLSVFLEAMMKKTTQGHQTACQPVWVPENGGDLYKTCVDPKLWMPYLLWNLLN